MGRSKKKKEAKLTPEQRKAKLRDSFGDATKCWAVENEEFCGKVLVQLEGTCYAHGAVRSLIAVSRACGIALTGSIQELIERLRFVFPHEKDDEKDEEGGFDPKVGIENTIQNCFEYIILHGLFLEKDYPLRRTIKNFNNIRIVHPPFKKIKIEDYYLIDVDEDAGFYGEVDAKLDQHPADVYAETTEQREEVKQLVEKIRKRVPRVDSDRELLLHSVLIVGYGDDYYVIQNSWGEEWGILGYAKVSKDCVIEAGWPVNVTLHDDIEGDFWEVEKERLLLEAGSS